jgi:hypothetical protein
MRPSHAGFTTSQRKDAEFELVDVAEYSLPLLDEGIPPNVGQSRPAPRGPPAIAMAMLPDIAASRSPGSRNEP